MRIRQQLALGVLLGGIGFASLAYSQAPAQREESLPQHLARNAKVSEGMANRIFLALGPTIREELSAGKEVVIPGLGTFRVVRVAEHRDLRNGRPVIIPAVNTVEFLADGDTLETANAESAQPAETVPAFQYIPLPDQTPSQKTPKIRVPPIRVR